MPFYCSIPFIRGHREAEKGFIISWEESQSQMRSIVRRLQYWYFRQSLCCLTGLTFSEAVGPALRRSLVKMLKTLGLWVADSLFFSLPGYVFCILMCFRGSESVKFELLGSDSDAAYVGDIIIPASSSIYSILTSTISTNSHVQVRSDLNPHPEICIFTSSEPEP